MQMPVVALETAVGPLQQRNRWYKQTWVCEAEGWRVVLTRRLVSESHERHLSCRFNSNSSHNKVGPLVRDADLTASTVKKIIRQNEHVINILVRSLFNLTLFLSLPPVEERWQQRPAGQWRLNVSFIQTIPVSLTRFFFLSPFFAYSFCRLHPCSVSLVPCLVLHLLPGRWWVSGILLFTTEAPFMLYLLYNALEELLN